MLCGANEMHALAFELRINCERRGRVICIDMLYIYMLCVYEGVALHYIATLYIYLWQSKVKIL